MQVLPETYEPPSDENWTTGIFACAEDPDSCNALSSSLFHMILSFFNALSLYGVLQAGLVSFAPVYSMGVTLKL